MKKVLILVISADVHPYEEMINTSLNTWDSIEVPNCETIFYCGQSNKKDTDKVIYLPIKDGLFQMGYKTILALEWALRNKEFDYIARVNSSCYVRKDLLVEHCQTLEENNVFSGIEVNDGYRPKWMFGGGQFIYSKDVVKKFVTHKSLWNHKEIEDVSISHLANDINIPYHKGKFSSINKRENDWLVISYPNAEKNFTFTNFEDMKKSTDFFFRVKCDGKREIDKIVMENLFNVFK